MKMNHSELFGVNKDLEVKAFQLSIVLLLPKLPTRSLEYYLRSNKDLKGMRSEEFVQSIPWPRFPFPISLGN